MDIQQGDYNPDLSNNAKETGGNLADIKTNTDNLASLIGFQIPAHDKQVIDEADSDNVTITYSLNDITVATKLIAVSGTTTTITVTFP